MQFAQQAKARGGFAPGPKNFLGIGGGIFLLIGGSLVVNNALFNGKLQLFMKSV